MAGGARSEATLSRNRASSVEPNRQRTTGCFRARCANRGRAAPTGVALIGHCRECSFGPVAPCKHRCHHLVGVGPLAGRTAGPRAVPRRSAAPAPPIPSISATSTPLGERERRSGLRTSRCCWRRGRGIAPRLWRALATDGRCCVLRHGGMRACGCPTWRSFGRARRTRSTRSVNTAAAILWLG